MLPEFARGSVFWEALFGAIIFLAAVGVALVVHPVLNRLARLLTARTKTTLDDVLLKATSRPLFVFILVHGLFLALTTISFLDRWQGYINRAWPAFTLAVIFYGLQRVLNGLIQWYGQELASRTKTRLDQKLLPLVRRFVGVAIYLVGTLLILDNLGIQLTPLIAGLGLSGLAVALALQPTLSNIFAGASVVADGTVGVGDFIELEGGPGGSVMDVGWRSTKIQTFQGNLVTIPNAKLLDTVVTNYQGPTPEMNAVISCGVSYESNLSRVEEVCIEVGRQVLAELPESSVVKDFEPIVRFREFGDSNVNFIVVLRAKDRGNTFLLTHEFMKRLHARFAEEVIEISYPVRKLVYAPTNGAPASLLAREKL